MENLDIFSEIDVQMQSLRRLILQHAREHDLCDEDFLVELHQLSHRLLTLKRMVRNGKNSSNEMYKCYLNHMYDPH
jgi:hypothetical protein